jgi:hypothetical protein
LIALPGAKKKKGNAGENMVISFFFTFLARRWEEVKAEAMAEASQASCVGVEELPAEVWALVCEHHDTATSCTQAGPCVAMCATPLLLPNLMEWQ